MPREVPQLPCPVCGYDCHAVESPTCSECGATLIPSLASPNVLVVGPWHLRLLVCTSLILLAAVVAGVISADVSRQRLAHQADLVQQNMSDLQDYRSKTVQWWNDMKGQRDPGLAPKAPVFATAVVEADSVPLWLAATRDSGPLLFFLGVAALLALAILWVSEAQQRRPIAVQTVRLVSGLVYFYAGMALLIAVIGVTMMHDL